MEMEPAEALPVNSTPSISRFSSSAWPVSFRPESG
jgi:hypothetical protein